MGGPAARSIAVTSCHRGEGRSTVALALALLERTTYDRRTLLVELDLEHPWLATPSDCPTVRGSPRCSAMRRRSRARCVGPTATSPC